MNRTKSWKFGLVLVPVLTIAMACGGDNGDDPDSLAVESSIRGMIDAWNQQDAEAFTSHWTSSALQDRFGASDSQIQEQPQEFLGEPQRVIREISDVSVRAGSGFARADIEAGRAVHSERYILVQQAGEWVIEAADQVEPDLDGATMLEVEMTDSAFQFDASAIEDGDLAFQAENMGTQPHELTLWQVPDGFDLDAALAEGSQTPTGVELIGSTGPVAPEVTGWFALIEPLPPGRYVMLCLLPDTAATDETTHAAQGMVAEFEITATAD